MPRYWVMRTDKNNIDLIYREVKEGRLRQGWGYQEDQNLDIIRSAMSEGKSLNDDQKVCWRGNRRMHPQEWDSIQKGDLILLPNLPNLGLWSIAKVVGDYYYQIHPNYRDYGHILKVELLNREKPVNPYSEFVSANLRKTMTNRLRLWNIDPYKEDVDKLISAIDRKEEVSKSISGIDKLLNIHSSLSKILEKEFRDKFHGSEFEEPIKNLLKKIYQNVERRAGSGEKGADFICSFTDGLGVSHKIAVQVKMREGKASWLRPLEQIEEAFDNYENVSAGVIITMADSFSDDFEKKKIEIEKERNIPIEIINKIKLANIFLKYFPEVVSNE